MRSRLDSLTPYNAFVTGFNDNGLVVLNTSSGVTQIARQTGNGELRPGQPVVWQTSGVPGVADVCFDPAATTAAKAVIQVPEPETVEDVDWEVCQLRNDGGYALHGLNNSPMGRRYTLPDGQTWARLPVITDMYGIGETKPSTDRAYAWYKPQEAVLYGSSRSSFSGGWNGPEGSLLQDRFGNGFSIYTTISDYDPSGNLRGGLVLRARKSLRVTSISVSSNHQPGGPHFDPSVPNYDASHNRLYPNGRIIGAQAVKHFLDFGVIRKGVEATALNHAYFSSYSFSTSGVLNQYKFYRSFEDTFANPSQTIKPKTLAKFDIESPAVDTFDKVVLRKTVSPALGKMSRGDILLVFMDYPYAPWQQGKYMWKIDKITTA